MPSLATKGTLTTADTEAIGQSRTEASTERGLTYVLGAGVAVLRIQGLKAAAAVGPPLLHDVALAAQHRLALEAAEVLHVPVSPLSFCAHVCKDDLQVERPRGQWGGKSRENTLQRRKAEGAPDWEGRKTGPTHR